MRPGDSLEIPNAGPTILLAEDDLTQRLLYTRILMGAGYYVIAVDNGIEAVTAARRDQPDLVLMDVTMPGKDGWTVSRELKADEATRRIPIILMTGLVGEAAEKAAAQAGCDAFLPKPLPVRTLLASVERFLPRGPKEGPS
jgi:CheY-like chemotaxis protein